MLENDTDVIVHEYLHYIPPLFLRSFQHMTIHILVLCAIYITAIFPTMHVYKCTLAIIILHQCTI